MSRGGPGAAILSKGIEGFALVVGSRPMAGRPAPGDGSGRGRGVFLLAGAIVLSAGTTALILTRHRLFAGLAALAAAIALLAADASAPRAGRSRAWFAGRVLDRVYEASILVPLAWVARTGPEGEAVLALVGLGASYLASYERAKGQALRYQGVERALFKRTRYAILVLALMTGWLLAWLWAYAILTVAAACVGAWNVARQDRRVSTTDQAVP
jgi:hypothetical protein